jgi:hypothetical protein
LSDGLLVENGFQFKQDQEICQENKENDESKKKFSYEKRAIFRKVKEIKYLSGGVVLYAAQSNAQTDTEIAEKGRFPYEN